MTTTRTLATLAVAFYLGATLALVMPFASPFWGPLSLGAYLLSGGRP